MSAAGASLRVAALSVTLAGRQILTGIDVDAPVGTFVSLVGPNGSGKSTLLRAIAGTVPAQGTIVLGDERLDTLPRRARARRIAQLPQESDSELPLLARDVVRLGRIPHEHAFGQDPGAERAVDAAIELSGVTPFLDRPFAELSGGERQRVRLAGALAQDPDVLLLDEPTNHLDLAAQLALLASLRTLARRGVTVIAALHDLAHAVLADQVVVLRDGAVQATGAPQDALTSAVVDRVFGVRSAWFTHPVSGKASIAVAPADPA